ncbi:carboxypeptidase regulatory-like domain-containing protein [Gilvimarinus sp. F26214L]|uniref:carboxypeptidase regulatory-like domain-containing protein n=1 Tax=Gilvimarinus sp. DZF01 TaxID=3461371 RepID=UPI004045ADB7
MPTRFTPALWLLILTCACFSSFSVAHEGIVHSSSEGDRSEEGLHWLDVQQGSDGAITAPADVATDFQATAEAAHAFGLFDYGAADLNSALAYLAAAPEPLNTEYLSRLATLQTLAGQNAQPAVSQLLARQNANGGFGHQQGFDSTPMDTAYALNALVASGGAGASVVGPALSYLAGEQNGNGGYSVSYDGPSSVAVTSLVVIALKHHLFSYNISGSLNGAIDYLYSQQQADGAWGDNWETALALRALVPVTTDVSRYEDSAALLAAAQSIEGDWDESPYATAMALAAVHLLRTVTVPADPSKASITGKLVSADSGAAISGASIEVSGSSVSPDIGDNGAFTIANLEPGAYQLTYSAPGYLSAVQSLTVSQGQLANVGTIRLNVSPTTAQLSGQVRDASTGAPIAGAQIEIDLGDASLTTSSDVEGNYQQTVPPGAATLTVTSAGYFPASVQTELRAGTHSVFSPSLTPVSEGEPVASTVLGTVVDADTGALLEGVLVATPDASATTDSSGGFVIEGLAAGELTLLFTKGGYEGVQASIVVPERATADLGQIALAAQVEQDSTTVSGQITDMGSGQPVANASVVIGPNSARTDANGFYEISGINLLEFEISVNATGYVFSRKLITLTEHTRITADIVLRRADMGGIAVKQVVTDKNGYGAYEPVQIAATLRNETAIEQRARLYVNVTDSSGALITSFPAVELPIIDDQSSEEEIAHFEEHLAESVEVLLPHEERTVALERWWNVGRTPPGDYQVTVQALDAATSQIMSELSGEAQIVATEDIASLNLRTSPEYALLDSSAEVEITASLFNRSNVPVNTELRYRLLTPSGVVITEGTANIELAPDTVNHSQVLETVNQDFTESGRYTLQAEVVSGVVPGLIKAGEVFVPPSTRLDVQQSLAPYEVAPLEGVEVQINIEVKGVDSEE